MRTRSLIDGRAEGYGYKRGCCEREEKRLRRVEERRRDGERGCFVWAPICVSRQIRLRLVLFASKFCHARLGRCKNLHGHSCDPFLAVLGPFDLKLYFFSDGS